MYGLIYKTINLVNNKIYIGQTIKLEEYKCGYYIGSGHYIKSSLNKYGKENFKSEILEYASNQEELDNLEIKYIKKYKSLVPNGYTIQNGGNGIGKHTKESRLKMSKSHTGGGKI